MAEKKVETNLKKNKKADIPTKGGKEYSYQYVDIAQIHEYLVSIGARYIQKIQRIESDDYIMTKRWFNGEWEEEWIQGCKVVDATLYGNDNPAQKQGSALTYARRYSLLMAFGLATEDDDAQSLNKEKPEKKEPETKITTLEEAENYKLTFGKYNGKTLKEIFDTDGGYIEWLEAKGDEQVKNCLKILEQANKEKMEQEPPWHSHEELPF